MATVFQDWGGDTEMRCCVISNVFLVPVNVGDRRCRELWHTTITCTQLASHRFLFGLFRTVSQEAYRSEGDLLFSDSLTVSLPSWLLMNTQLSKILLLSFAY